MLRTKQFVLSSLVVKLISFTSIILIISTFIPLYFNKTHSHKVYALQAPRLNAFDPVVSILNDDNLSQEWQFSGQANQIISLVASRRTGDLDPVITLVDSEGAIVASNDNSTFTNQTARLEAIQLPQNDIYTVQVSREGMNYGSTSGQFELVLLEGLSVFDNAAPITRVIQLDQGSSSTQRALTAIPDSNFFTTFELAMPESSVPFALEWTFRDAAATGDKWVVRFNTDGDYDLSFQNAESEPLYNTAGNAANQLPSGGETVSISFWANNQTFSLWVDNQQVDFLTVPDTLEPTLVDAMTVTLETNETWNENNALVISIQNLWVTTLFYGQSPSHMGAIPPTPAGERIYGTSTSEIITELQNLQFIPNTTAEAGIQARIDTGYVYSEEAGFNAYTLVERPFQDFVIGYTSKLVLGETTTACGIMFRQNDDATFATVLVTPEQELYFLQYRDGIIQSEGLSTISPVLVPEIDTENQFIITAFGNEGNLFVNGRLMGNIELEPLDGSIWAHVVLANHAPAYCQIDNLWVWTPD